MKKTPLKKKGKSHTPEWYRKKCVEIAKIEAKERDDYTCQKCGKKPEKIDGSHVYPEGTHHSLSADIDNIKALCSYCHLWWWHKNPIEAQEWFKKKFPERYKKLKELSRKTIKTDWKKEYEVRKMQRENNPENTYSE